MADNTPKDLIAEFQKLRVETSEMHNRIAEKSFTDTVGTSMNYEILKELRAIRQEIGKLNEEKDRQMNEMKEEMTKKFHESKQESECQMRVFREELGKIQSEMTKMSLRVDVIDLKLSKPASIVDEIIGEWYSEDDRLFRKYVRKDDTIIEFVRSCDEEYDNSLTTVISISEAIDDRRFQIEGTFFDFSLFIQNGRFHLSYFKIGTLEVVGTAIYKRIQ